jgi:hypothetical protein
MDHASSMLIKITDVPPRRHVLYQVMQQHRRSILHRQRELACHIYDVCVGKCTGSIVLKHACTQTYSKFE